MTPSIRRNDWIAPVVYLIYISLADLFPITCQLISVYIVLGQSQGSYKRSSSLKRTNKSTKTNGGEYGLSDKDDNQNTSKGMLITKA